jgi:DNA-binding PadR family transcriptional regulator
MAPTATARRSPLGLVVLWMLAQQPLHVYGMQKLLEAQGKDRVVNVRSRASLYQAIQRLVRLGLVEVSETVRVAAYPDRVVYAITDAGREAARTWLREMLRTTGAEYPEFIVAVSLLFALPPEDARAQLEQREQALVAELADTEAAMDGAPRGLPRLFLLEEEYRKALLEAELAWLREVMEDIRTQRLDWTERWLREMAEAFGPPNDDDAEDS